MAPLNARGLATALLLLCATFGLGAGAAHAQAGTSVHHGEISAATTDQYLNLSRRVDQSGSDATPPNLTGALRRWVGDERGYGEYSDVRCFLATCRFTIATPPETHFDLGSLRHSDFELEHSWHKVSGGPYDGEWYISLNSILGKGPYVLDDLDNLTGLGGLYDMRHSETLDCDFIFRLDVFAYRGISNTDDLYTIEYVLTRGRVTTDALGHDHIDTTSLPVTDTVRATIRIVDYVESPSEEYTLQYYPSRQHHRYAFKRTQFPTDVTDPHGRIGTYRLYKLNCRLRPQTNYHGIFVRGLRIRTDKADKLFRGDPTEVAPLESVLRGILKQPNYALATNNAVCTAGEETRWPSFRAFAIIDQRWQALTGGNLIVPSFSASFDPNFKEHYRAIYEEETGFMSPVR